MIRVLCVEDDPLVRTYLTERLSLESDIGVVNAVPDAGSACACLREEEVDVVLLDYQLPGTDGLQLLQAISLWYENLPEGRRRPSILFCTGYGGDGFEVQARALGADGIVAKA